MASLSLSSSASLPLSLINMTMMMSPSSSLSARFFPNVHATKPPSKTSCKANTSAQNSPADDHHASSSKNGKTPSAGKIERRNVLLGMGSLCGVTTLTTANNPLAFATPVTPDFSDCTYAEENKVVINCCPPSGPEVTDFKPSAKTAYPRIPAHTATETYIKNYSKAISRMKNLKLTDPRNFYQQANVHCVYCDEGYTQSGYPGTKIDVHASWFFFPWHRMYLYFFERICQNMLDDDSFTLPFWQWDDESGMKIPPLYNDSKSSLYDCLRDPNHLPPAIVDLVFSPGDPPTPPATQIKYNYVTMFFQMIIQSSTPQKFFGKTLSGGDNPDPGKGSIESGPHDHVHLWTGNPGQPNREDMGILYAAARDPIFYAHHANVDRMWYIYNNYLGGKNFTSTDWYNSSFIFYNEEAKPVRVTVKDFLDVTKLGYSYPDLKLKWLDLNFKPTPRRTRINIALGQAPNPQVVFPRPLDKTISVLVDRPKKSRSKREKDEAEETLEIQGIEYDKGDYVKFDVYVNEDDPSLSGPDKAEFLGSFINLVHGHRKRTKSNKDFALNKVLEELGADDFDKILVTIVPISGAVTINGIQISYDTSKA